MKFVYIDGIGDAYLGDILGTNEWYSCKVDGNIDCDLYEAEQIVRSGKTYSGMNRKLVHYPDGKVYSPFKTKENVYVDAPVFDQGIFYFLVVDFSEEMIQIFSYQADHDRLNKECEFELASVKNCYNLMLKVSPVTLIREGDDNILEIIWPEKCRIEIGDTEALYFRDGSDLYCCDWYEDPDYHEHVIVRDLHTGSIKEKYIGQMKQMPNGDVWITRE